MWESLGKEQKAWSREERNERDEKGRASQTNQKYNVLWS